MFKKNSRFTKYIGIPSLVILATFMIGYQVTIMAERFEPAQHEQAMDWNVLEDAYAATQGANEEPAQQQALATLKALQGKEMMVYGYMFPIHTGDTHDHFLLMARNLSCQFCFPSDARNLIEVSMKNTINYQRQPLLIKGTFAMSDKTEMGVIYRLDNATQQPE